MKTKSYLLIIIATLFIFTSCKSLNHRFNKKFIDNRDGKAYKVVNIGNQIWFAENLAFKTNEGCWAYENDDNYVAIYGYLYNLETAKNVCPDGWHLPTGDELDTLINYLGGELIAGEKLKNSTGWKLLNGSLRETTGWVDYENKNFGNNLSGFSAIPGGWYNNLANEFKFEGERGNWWVDDPKGWENYFSLIYFTPNTFYEESINNGFGRSVRCIKDE